MRPSCFKVSRLPSGVEKNGEIVDEGKDIKEGCRDVTRGYLGWDKLCKELLVLRAGLPVDDIGTVSGTLAEFVNQNPGVTAAEAPVCTTEVPVVEAAFCQTKVA